MTTIPNTYALRIAELEAEIGRLKEVVEVRTQSWMNTTDALSERDDWLKALQCRLDAAERVCEIESRFMVHHPSCPTFDDKRAECGGCTPMNKALASWRRSRAESGETKGGG